MGFFEGVFFEVEDDEFTAGLQDAKCFVNGFLWVDRVVEGLAEVGEVDAVFGEGYILNIAEVVFEVFDAIFGGEFLAELDHFRGVINAINFFCVFSE